MSRSQATRTFALAGLSLIVLLTGSCGAQNATPADEQALIRSYNATALQLYRELGKDSENIVISPYSIGTAMSMALAGARGETEREMASVLNQSLPREAMNAASASVLGRLRSLQQGGNVELTVANALCLTRKGDQVHRTYRDLLRDKYDAKLFTALDVAPINAWVSKQTHGRIETILPSRDAQTVCVLLNAIYFKGRWAHEFDKQHTRLREFYTLQGETILVPVMSRTGKYSSAAYADFAALALPYEADSLAMVILLPTEKAGLVVVEEQLTSQLVQSVLDDLGANEPATVPLVLPTFKVATGASLISPFRALGMQLPFSTREADFGGIAGREHAIGTMWIGAIEHKALLEVDEQGTEAVATTIVHTKAAVSIKSLFIVDHPFLFLVVDRASGVILFMGRVLDPLRKA